MYVPPQGGRSPTPLTAHASFAWVFSALMIGGLAGSVTVADISPLDPLPLIVICGAVVYPDPPFDMLTVAIGPVVPNVAVTVCAVPPPLR